MIKFKIEIYELLLYIGFFEMALYICENKEMIKKSLKKIRYKYFAELKK